MDLEDREAMSDRVADIATAIVEATSDHIAGEVILALCFVLAEIELETDEPDATRILSHVDSVVPAILKIMQRITKENPDMRPEMLFKKMRH